MLKYLVAGNLLKKHNARVDNVMFHLHYRITVIICMVSSALITAKEYFGSPIECYSKSTAVPSNVLNTYCFIMSTYTLPKHNGTSDNTVHPGVGAELPGDETIVHSYYQWIPLALFLMGFSFYIPRMLWKSFDGGLFSSILMGLDKICLDTGAIRSKCMTLTDYLNTHLNMHRNWSIRFFVCELLCLVIDVLNIYMIDKFLGGTFLEYGSEVFKIAEADSATRTDHMDKVFPRVTKCRFMKFGTSGSLETHDSMCVLALNILNVKIFIFLWYWLMALTIVAALWLVFRLLVLLSPRLRAALLNSKGRLAGREVVSRVGQNVSIGDWFLLYQLGSWMHPIDFGAFLRIIARQMDGEIDDGSPRPSAPALDTKPMRPS